MNNSEVAEWTTISEEIDKIIQVAYSSESLRNKTGLQYINDSMINIIEPLLKKYDDKASEYIEERKSKNIKLFKITTDAINELTEKLQEIGFPHQIHLMSSLGAGLNLITESDIDIGVLVKDLDEVKLFAVAKILNQIGYKFDHIFNPHIEDNKYYSFTLYYQDDNDEEKVELEIKVRDLDKSMVVLELHYYLDTQLTDEQRRLYTYAKLVLKGFSKETYKKFKLLIYNSAFSHVKNGFLLAM